jgi:hypothetical protein
MRWSGSAWRSSLAVCEIGRQQAGGARQAIYGFREGDGLGSHVRVKMSGGQGMPRGGNRGGAKVRVRVPAAGRMGGDLVDGDDGGRRGYTAGGMALAGG